MLIVLQRLFFSLFFSAAVLFYATGCGSDDDDSSGQRVRVVDHYVLGATVTDSNQQTATAAEERIGYYIFPNGSMGVLTSKGGCVDINVNNSCDDDEPLASTLKAPEGYKYITPFTTLFTGIDGYGSVSFDQLKIDYPSLEVKTSLDFNPQVEAEDDLALAKDTAKAALKIAYALENLTPFDEVADDPNYAGALVLFDAANSRSELNSIFSDELGMINGNVAGTASSASSEASSSSIFSSSSSTAISSAGSSTSVCECVPGVPCSCSSESSSSSSAVADSSSSLCECVPGVPCSCSSESSSSSSAAADSSSSLCECVPGVPCDC